LNEHLDKFQHLDKFHNSNAWSDVKKFLDYHSTTCHPHANYPKGTLSTEQRGKFDWLRKNEIVRNKYNVLAEEREQFQKQEDEELERKRQEGQRHAREMMIQNMRLNFYR
jgi:hypothetical protein